MNHLQKYMVTFLQTSKEKPAIIREIFTLILSEVTMTSHELYLIDFTCHGVSLEPFGEEGRTTEIDEHTIRFMGKVHIVPKLMAMFLICKSYSFQFNRKRNLKTKIILQPEFFSFSV